MTIEEFVNSGSAWSFIFFGEAGLLFRILYAPFAEKRRLRWSDLGWFGLYSIFVVVVSLLLLASTDLKPIRNAAMTGLIGLLVPKVWPWLEKKLNQAGPGIALIILKFLASSAGLGALANLPDAAAKAAKAVEETPELPIKTKAKEKVASIERENETGVQAGTSETTTE